MTTPQGCRCCVAGNDHDECCPGHFFNEETREVERCDECALFRNDIEAEAAFDASRSVRVDHDGDEISECTFAELFATNPDTWPGFAADVRALLLMEPVRFGGGAMPLVTITRIR